MPDKHGTHEVLMARNRVYAELYRIQIPEKATIGAAPPVFLAQ